MSVSMVCLHLGRKIEGSIKKMLIVDTLLIEVRPPDDVCCPSIVGVKRARASLLFRKICLR